MMTASFDVMSIWVEHKCAIIVFMVMRPKPRRAVIFASSCNRRLIEFIHLFTAFRAKSDMNPGFIWSAFNHPKVRLRRNSIAEDDYSFGVFFWDFSQHFISEGCEGFLVKASTLGRITDFNAGVVNHFFSLT